ncbi:hypothetical protein HGA88_00580 [Candidatus Roizmanbacteria bacterium]|nr:hypothetical protein [Candidatus Roizmanbacteria bacterium]
MKSSTIVRPEYAGAEGMALRQVQSGIWLRGYTVEPMRVLILYKKKTPHGVFLFGQALV